MMYVCGPIDMDRQRQDDHLEPTYSSSVPIQDVTLKTCRRQWTIGNGGKRRSWISVLIAWRDDDYDTVKFNMTHKYDPIRCYLYGPEWTWERWQWRCTLHSPKLQHYWCFIIRSFSVISRTFVCWSLTLLQRSSWCILQPQPNRQPLVTYSYADACRNIFNTIKTRGHSSLEKITSHFIRKRYERYYCVRGELETEQNCNILTPQLFWI